MSEGQGRRHRQRIEAGLCSRCGKVPPAQGVLMCEDCRNYHKNWSARQWQNEEGKAKRRAKLREWQENNRELTRVRAIKYLRVAKKAVFAHYGQVCACCGESNPGFLTIDHINNDGAEHRRNHGGNLYLNLRARGFPEGFQTLCWNCNCGRAHNGGICPHKQQP
jgi:hypothetical protein